MKRNFIAIAAMLILSASAHAVNFGDTTNNQGGHGGHGGQGGSAAAGAIAGAAAGAAAGASAGVTSTIGNTVRNDVSSTNLNANTNSVRNDNTNAQQQGQGQLQGQQQGQQQQAVSNSGGNTQRSNQTNAGNNSAQSTSVTVQGDVTESNTPPVVAGVLPSVPTSCRLYLFGGGSTRDGAGSGTFPIGNDQTCLSIAALNLMERAGGFTQAEKQTVVCKVEGMAEFPTCKAIAQK